MIQILFISIFLTENGPESKNTLQSKLVKNNNDAVYVIRSNNRKQIESLIIKEHSRQFILSIELQLFPSLFIIEIQINDMIQFIDFIKFFINKNRD